MANLSAQFYNRTEAELALQRLREAGFSGELFPVQRGEAERDLVEGAYMVTLDPRERAEEAMALLNQTAQALGPVRQGDPESPEHRDHGSVNN